MLSACEDGPSAYSELYLNVHGHFDLGDTLTRKKVHKI